MATTYLGINMSGRNLNVVNTSGGNIGTLYHKERFTYSFELRTINGKSYKKIWFLNRSGNYGEGFLLNSDPIKNWDEYYFPSGFGNFFKIDRDIAIYDQDGNWAVTARAGGICRLQNRCQTGNKNKHFGLLDFYDKDFFNVPNFNKYKGYFIDTGVAKSSTNTAVYGKWN